MSKNFKIFEVRKFFWKFKKGFVGNVPIVRRTNVEKSTQNCLDELLEKLRHLQHSLNSELRSKHYIHDKLLSACRDIKICSYVCYMSISIMTDLIDNLRSFIMIYQTANFFEIFFINRKYYDSRNSNRSIFFMRTNSRPLSSTSYEKNKCFVCLKEECWSFNHIREERMTFKKKFKKRFERRFDKTTAQYIVDFEEVNYSNEKENDDDEIDQIKVMIIDVDDISSDSLTSDYSEALISSFDSIQNVKMMMTDLNNRAFEHFLIHEISTTNMKNSNPFVYIATERYSTAKFYEIMIDTSASRHFTTEYDQYLTYEKYYDNISIDIQKAGVVHVQFDIDAISFMRSIKISTLVKTVEFHVVKTNIFFLLCLTNMNRLNIYYNNIQNVLVMKNRVISIICRFDHSFMLWNSCLQVYLTELFDDSSCHLTEKKLRQLHCRFDHSSALKLRRVLEQSEHEDVLNKKLLDKLTRYCSYCQKHDKSSDRFKFTLRENVNFNHFIIVDIMYVKNSSLLHVINKTTRFQTARWLLNIIVKHI